MNRIVVRRSVLRSDGETTVGVMDSLAVEEPLEMRVGGTPFFLDALISGMIAASRPFSSTMALVTITWNFGRSIDMTTSIRISTDGDTRVINWPGNWER